MSQKLEPKDFQKQNPPKKSLIPEKYKTPAFIIVLAVLLIFFFRDGIFNGSFWGASDNISPASFITYKEQKGDFPLWQPYIFSGMPGMAAMMEAASRYWDVTIYAIYGVGKFVGSFFDSNTAKMAFWYLVFGAGMFFLMRQHKHERWTAFFTSIAMTFGTGIVIWMMIGHNSKPLTVMMAPYLFIMYDKLKEKCSILNIALTILCMHIMMEGGHVQMMFYLACALFIYLVIDIINSIIGKTKFLPILRSAAVFLVATGVAFLMSSDKYLSVLEYTPYSTRGSSSIVKQANAGANTADAQAAAGQDYEYATKWSFSPGEMIDFLVPAYHGFGKVDYSGPLTNGRETKIMTYWGQKPFEDAAPYMGTFVLFLAILGCIYYFKKDPFVQAMVITSIFGLLLSFGYTFPVLYDLFFYHFPKFSSFRAPSMSLVLMQICIPVLAGYGITAIMNLREKYGDFKQISKKEKNPLKVFFIMVGLFVAAGLIFIVGFEYSYVQNIINSPTLKGYGEGVAQQLSGFIWDNTVSDWLVIGLLCIVVSILIYMFINKKISTLVFMVMMSILVIFDLWRVDYRPMEVVDKNIEKQPFAYTDVVDFVLKDRQNERFRVCDLSSQIANSDAYFLIENINGYHSAKLRTYQDMLDVCCEGSTSNVTSPFLWSLLNAKYIIVPQQLNGGIQPLFQSRQTGAFVYYNNSYCKRAFFVDSVKVEKPMNILNHLKDGDFNPKTLAYIEENLESEIQPSHAYEAEVELQYKLMQQQALQADSANPASNDTAHFDLEINAPKANIVDYKNEYIKIETESKEQHLLVLSEMYYPVSWRAYIDGKETKIYKTDFVLRSVVVPAGNHTVEFKFISEKFELGKTLSTCSNIFLILILIGGIIIELRKKKQNKTSD